MSFSDAISQVDQILQWEQQLSSGSALNDSTTGGVSADGAASSATGATTVSTGSASGSGSGTAASFADALAQAQYAGDSTLLSSDADTSATDALTANLTDAAGSADSSGSVGSSELLSGGDSQLLAALSALTSGSATAGSATAGSATAGAATSASDPRIQAMIQEANALVGKPYVWGGGHSGWGTQSGYDCSGFVSAVLHAGGYLSSPQDTTTLPSAPGIESGPGQYVTIYDRDAPGQEGHVIIDLNGQFYESGGEHGSWGGGGGVEPIATPSAAYLSTFNLVLHPEGL